jgi:hypothetical protein
VLTVWGALPAFLFALLVFGFAPGAVLRLIVRAFPRDDPRRRELLAELYVVPRMDRPFWVFEQIELALFEGLWGRIVWAATGRVIDRWQLGSGVERHRMYPETFWIPTSEERLAIEPGMVVKLMFEMKDGWGERMWVRVWSMNGRHLIGTLVNEPVGIPRLTHGDTIKFNHDHVIDLDWPSPESGDEAALSDLT